MTESPAAVVLAGVHDWGACVLNQAVVRPLAPIANRAVVEHVLEALGRAGVKRVVICANGHSREMRDVLGNGRAIGMEIRYREDGMPRGPAGCVKDAAAELGADEFIVAEATIVPHFDIAELIGAHRRTGACLTIATRETRAGNERTHEPVGIYVCSRLVMSYIGDTGFQDIKEGVVPKLHEAGLRVDVHPIDGAAPRLFGIGSYFAVNEWATKVACSGAWDMDGYAMEGTALVHVDARVDESVRLLGPVIVGPHSVLQKDAIIVGPTTIDRDCVVGEGAVVSRSALWSGSAVGARSHVDRSVLTHDARIGVDERHYSSVSLADSARRRRPATRSNGGGPKVPGDTPEARPRMLRR